MKNRFHFDKNAPGYRDQFEAIAAEMQSRCPVAWSDAYGGHWVAAGNREVFEIARAVDYVSNDHDVFHRRRGYKGISIPAAPDSIKVTGGILEMDPPRQRHWRTILNPYLSPAAVARWIPLVDDLIRACVDEKIESGRIDFVDDLANVVPAVLTLGMMGIAMKDWTIYCEPSHAGLYTPPDSPDTPRVRGLQMAMHDHLHGQLQEITDSPRPGLVDAIARGVIDGEPAEELERIGILALIIGGGFDTTTALTAHSLEWLSGHPADRARLSANRDALLDSATEEFLRFYAPAVGDGRTISADCVLAGTEMKEGDRVWLSWAMANRDPSVFPRPNEVDLARTGNRHYSFGLGIHRCIGSNVARVVFKRMLVAVLDRMPDYQCVPGGVVHYDTVGMINGIKKLPATFTPGPRTGDGIDETIARIQAISDERRLAEPVTRGSTAGGATEL
jgi:cytochrome P450